MLSTDLPPKELVVLIACSIFFGLCLSIWVVARCFPAWDARQLERQRRRVQRPDLMDEALRTKDRPLPRSG